MAGHDDWYEIKKRYLVKETIGSGGFGKVKRAVHIATTETVAIKVTSYNVEFVLLLTCITYDR